MEPVAWKFFNNYNMVIDANPSCSFYSFLGGDKNKDAHDTHSQMINLYQKLMDEYIIK